MKTTIISIALFAAIVILAGCKEDPSKFRVKTSYHIHKVTYEGHEEVSGGKTDTFYYTPDGKRDFSANGTNTKYERKGNIAVWTTYDKSGKISAVTTSFFNEKGLEDSVENRDATDITYSHKYIYDSNGYVIEERQYQPQPPTTLWKYKVVDGNRVEEIMSNIPSVDTVMMPNAGTGKIDTFVTQYFDVVMHKDYYLDKLNFPTIQNYGYPNKDIHSKNLEKTAVQLSLKGDTQDVYSFHYTFDEKGRVISAVQLSRTGYEYDSTAYTYY